MDTHIQQSITLQSYLEGHKHAMLDGLYAM